MSVFRQLMMRSKVTEPIVPDFLKMTTAGESINLYGRIWTKTYDGLAYCCCFKYQVTGENTVWIAPMLVSEVKDYCENSAEYGHYPATISNTPFNYKGKNWYYVNAQSSMQYSSDYNNGRYLLNDGEIFTGTFEEVYLKAAKALMEIICNFSYQYVDYIETTGTQWINVGLTPNSDTRVVTKIRVTTTQQDKPVFGCETGTNTGSYYHMTCYNNKWFYGKNGTDASFDGYNNTIGTEYEIDFNNNGSIFINNELKASNIGTGGIGPLGIAARGSNYRGVYAYYYFQVYQNGSLIRDLSPIYSPTIKQYSMYDKLNNKFYPNSGTGDLTGGND